MAKAKFSISDGARVLLLTLMPCASFSAVNIAQSQIVVWDGGGADDNWSTANNWDPDTPPPNDGSAFLVFSGPSNGGRLTPQVDAAWSVYSINFNGVGAAFAIGGSPLTVREI